MDGHCSACGTVFHVDAGSVPPGGALLRCPGCGANVTVLPQLVDLGLDVPENPGDPGGELGPAGVFGVAQGSPASGGVSHAPGGPAEALDEPSEGSRPVRMGPPTEIGQVESFELDAATPAPTPPPVVAPTRPPRESTVSRPTSGQAVAAERSRVPAGAQVADSVHRAVSRRARSGRWQSLRGYAALGLFVAAVSAGVVGWQLWRNRPPPPPEVPNPLRERVIEWRQAGFAPTQSSVDAAVVVVRRLLLVPTPDNLRRALDAARSALLFDEDDGGALAAYGLVVAEDPDPVEPQVLVEALAAVNSAIGEEPNGEHRVELEVSRTWLLLRQAQLDEARRAGERAVELAPADTDAQVALAVAVAFADAKDAVRRLEPLAATEGSSGLRARLALGDAFVLAGRVSEALRLWEGAAAGAAPEGTAPRRRLAQLWVDLGEWDRARAVYDVLDATGQACAGDLLIASRLAAERGDGARAMELLGHAIAVASTPLNKARVLTQQVATVLSDRSLPVTPQQVSQWIDQALDAAPDLPELLYVAALADERMGDTKSAMDSLDAAHGVAPDSPEIALQLAWMLRGTAKAQARGVLDQAVREAPDCVGCHLLVMRFELDAGNRTSALASLRRALSFDPEARRTVLRLSATPPPRAALLGLAADLGKQGAAERNGWLLSAAGMAAYLADDLTAASAWLTRALREDPEDFGARLYLGLTSLRLDRAKWAERDLRAADRIDRRHPVSRLYLARLLENKRRFVEALSIFQDLAEQNPLAAAPRVGYARTLAAMGRRKEAVTEALRVTALRKRDRDALRVLAGLGPVVLGARER